MSKPGPGSYLKRQATQLGNTNHSRLYHNHEVAVADATRQLTTTVLGHSDQSRNKNYFYTRGYLNFSNELIAHCFIRSARCTHRQLNKTQGQRSIMLLLLHIYKNKNLNFIASNGLDCAKLQQSVR